jgi:hypothetical protein
MHFATHKGSKKVTRLKEYIKERKKEALSRWRLQRQKEGKTSGGVGKAEYEWNI